MSNKIVVRAANDVPAIIDGEVVRIDSDKNASQPAQDVTPAEDKKLFPTAVRKILGGFGTGHAVLPNQALTIDQLRSLPPAEQGELLSVSTHVDPGIVSKIQNAKNKLRYWRWNPFSSWNRKVDQWTKNESWEHQREVHIQRWSGLAYGYRVLFGRIWALFRRPASKAPRYATFDDMLFEQGIDKKELERLIQVRRGQVVMFYGFMAVPFLSACFFIYHQMVWMFLLNIWMFLMLGGLNMLFIIELWRLENRRLGGFKQWLAATK